MGRVPPFAMFVPPARGRIGPRCDCKAPQRFDGATVVHSEL